MTSSSDIAQPRRHARVDAADMLRGFAVMAIILLHSIEHFNFYSFPDTAGQSSFLNFCDKAIWDGLFFVFGGKAYAIFAMLFGFSFFIQHDNQRMRGKDFRLRFCWRLILLFIIGNFNACFFTGEILVMYSLVGFVLVLTCRFTTKWIVAIATICLLQPTCIYQIIRAICSPDYVIPQIESGPFWEATFAMQTAGDFWGTVKVNLWEGQARVARLGLGTWPHLPDRRTLHDGHAHRATGLAAPRQTALLGPCARNRPGMLLPPLRTQQHARPGIYSQSQHPHTAEDSHKARSPTWPSW